MRHKKGNRKMSRPTDQRLALIRAQVCALFLNNKILTTHVRAKEVRKQVDRMITLAKKNTLASKRHIVSFVHDKKVARKIWSQTEKFSARKSGYTRIIPVRTRRGDAAKEVLLELVDLVNA